MCSRSIRAIDGRDCIGETKAGEEPRRPLCGTRGVSHDPYRLYGASIHVQNIIGTWITKKMKYSRSRLRLQREVAVGSPPTIVVRRSPTRQEDKYTRNSTSQLISSAESQSPSQSLSQLTRRVSVWFVSHTVVSQQRVKSQQAVLVM